MGNPDPSEQASLKCERVRQILGLLDRREAMRLGADWKADFLKDWCDLVVARNAHLAEMSRTPEQGWSCSADCWGGDVPSGQPNEGRSKLCEVSGRDPGLVGLANLFDAAGRARLHHDLLGAAEWHESPTFREVCEAAGLGAYIASYLQLETAERILVVRVFRQNGDQPFSHEDGEVCRILCERLGVLYASERPHEDPPASDLSARVKQVLDLLLTGNSEKQIASALGLSRHTVHHHVKAVYKRFGINSRPELMTLCLSEGSRLAGVRPNMKPQPLSARAPQPKSEIEA